MKAFHYMMLLLLMGICVAGCSKDRGQTVEELNVKALNLLQAGLHDQALAKATAALEKSEKERGAGHPATVMSLEIIGLVYEAMGDAGKAESMFLRALSVVKESVGSDTEEAAKIMNNLAGLYYAQNQYDKAVSFFKQSLAVGEKQLPADDPRLAIMRKNIAICERLQNNGAAAQSAEGPGIVGQDLAADSQTSAPIQSPPMNLVQDLVPQEVKDSMVSHLARQNILISDLEPQPPVLIEGKGMVFPYHALKKGKETDAVQEIIVLFAAIKNPEKPNAMIFQQCRLISHASYLAAIEKGGMAQLKQEIQEVFPTLYL